jgi:glucose/arabinose dehydrogenase
MGLSFSAKFLAVKIVAAGAALGMMAVTLSGCGDQQAALPVSAGVGADPQLPEPNTSFIPTVNIAPAKGWKDGSIPVAAAVFADDLDHPRWLYTLPNGDVLVAETNAPPKPDDNAGLKGWFMRVVMKRAGAVTKSANRITLLRDADGDGIVEKRTTFLSDLNSPFGMVLVGNTLYIANSDAVVKVPYRHGQAQIDDSPAKLIDLPAGPINHHWTKSLTASPDGKRLYVGVGSNSNAAENGMDKEYERASIWEIDAAAGTYRLYATGLRNPVGLEFEPTSGELWTVVNERDDIGSDLVPDYLTSVKYGKFYGWPYSYFGKNLDPRIKERRPDLVARAAIPDYGLGAHVAPLGLTFARKGNMPGQFSEGAFVGEHGSWNREPKSGYKVVFVPFASGRPSGDPVDVLTGFLDDKGNARGRPVGVALDRKGALLVADDVGNRIWRVSGDESLVQAPVKPKTDAAAVAAGAPKPVPAGAKTQSARKTKATQKRAN